MDTAIGEQVSLESSRPGVLDPLGFSKTQLSPRRSRDRLVLPFLLPRLSLAVNGPHGQMEQEA